MRQALDQGAAQGQDTEWCLHRFLSKYRDTPHSATGWTPRDMMGGWHNYARSLTEKLDAATAHEQRLDSEGREKGVCADPRRQEGIAGWWEKHTQNKWPPKEEYAKLTERMTTWENEEDNVITQNQEKKDCLQEGQQQQGEDGERNILP